MGIPQPGPGYPLASPDAPVIKSLECGFLFLPSMFLWLVGIYRTLGTRSWGLVVGLCLFWQYVKAESVY